MYINKRQIRKLIHENGLKSSRSFINALDQFVTTQVVAALKETKAAKKVILQRKNICLLFPVEIGIDHSYEPFDGEAYDR
jgi:hypothetical protein